MPECLEPAGGTECGAAEGDGYSRGARCGKTGTGSRADDGDCAAVRRWRRGGNGACACGDAMAGVELAWAAEDGDDPRRWLGCAVLAGSGVPLCCARGITTRDLSDE